MMYSEQQVSSTLSAFAFREEETEVTTQETGSNCDGGFFQFHGTESDAEDRWCGFAFNSNEAATTGGTQYASNSNPWQAQVNAEEATEDEENPNVSGFSLIAQQRACTSALGGDTTQDI